MKKHDDYICGPHHYWLHFLARFLFGGLLGDWISSGFFDGLVLITIATAIAAVSVALFLRQVG